MIRVATPITGPQLWIADRRVHHFTIGAALALLGALLMAHDHRDAAVCWRDLRRKVR